MKAKLRAMTVRLPARLYQAGSRLAKRRRVSMNRLLQESLQAALAAEEQKRLYEAFGAVGAESEEADVEFALSAQRQVVERGEA
jgi:predicted transcriptional regulator